MFKQDDPENPLIAMMLSKVKKFKAGNKDEVPDFSEAAKEILNGAFFTPMHQDAKKQLLEKVPIPSNSPIASIPELNKIFYSRIKDTAQTSDRTFQEGLLRLSQDVHMVMDVLFGKEKSREEEFTMLHDAVQCFGLCYRKVHEGRKTTLLSNLPYKAQVIKEIPSTLFGQKYFDKTDVELVELLDKGDKAKTKLQQLLAPAKNGKARGGDGNRPWQAKGRQRWGQRNNSKFQENQDKYNRSNRSRPTHTRRKPFKPKEK